ATVKGKEEAPAAPQPAPEVPPQPRDATRAEKEEIVYLNLSELFPSKDHPFGVRDDAEMKGLWSRSRTTAYTSPRWYVPARAAAMKSSRATAASGPVSWPGLGICPVSSAT